MQHNFRFFLLGLFLSITLVFSACSGTTNPLTKVIQNASIFSNSSPKNFTKSQFTVSEYIQWLKQQSGITFATAENQKYKISILYKPLELEAALSLPQNEFSQEKLNKQINLKKDFQYFLFEFLNKTPALFNEKYLGDSILNNFQKHGFLFISNKVDTLANPIVEVFKSPIPNKPHQIIVLIPRIIPSVDLQVKVFGESLDLANVELQISKGQFETLPELKL